MRIIDGREGHIDGLSCKIWRAMKVHKGREMVPLRLKLHDKSEVIHVFEYKVRYLYFICTLEH